LPKEKTEHAYANSGRLLRDLRDFYKQWSLDNGHKITSKQSADEKLAGSIGYSKKQLENWLCGKNHIPYEQMLKMVHFVVQQSLTTGDLSELFEKAKILGKSVYQDNLKQKGHSVAGCSTESECINQIAAFFENTNVANSVKSSIAKMIANIPARYLGEGVERTDIIRGLLEAINSGKIVYVTGLTGVGKSHMVANFADKYIKNLENNCQIVLWLEDNSKSLTFDNMIATILNLFNHPNLSVMDVEERKAATTRHLSSQKLILVLDNFESIQKDEKAKIIRYILDNRTSEMITFITSKKKMRAEYNVSKNAGSFKHYTISPLGDTQYDEFIKILSDDNPDIKNALEVEPNLKNFAFEITNGNAYGTQLLLAKISSKIMLGQNLDKIREDYKSEEVFDLAPEEVNEWLANSAYTELLPAEKSLVKALSLFAVPVTLDRILEVAGLENDSILQEGLEKCVNFNLILESIKDREIKFSLPPVLRPVLQKIVRDDLDSIIIQNWIVHIRSITDGLGLCYNDITRLDKLDSDKNAKESENIKLALKFCRLYNRYEDFYHIAEGARYYFYTRGISGRGKRSIHYFRWKAAKKIGNIKKEFYSLLYHCNVASKMRDFETMEECFERARQIMTEHSDEISTVNQLKHEYIKALYHLNINNLPTANLLFENYGVAAKKLINDPSSLQDNHYKNLLHDYSAYLRWSAECLFRMAQSEDDKAKKERLGNNAIEKLNKAIELGFDRSIAYSHLRIAMIQIEIFDCKEEATESYEKLDEYAEVVANDAQYSEWCNVLKERLEL